MLVLRLELTVLAPDCEFGFDCFRWFVLLVRLVRCLCLFALCFPGFPF